MNKLYVGLLKKKNQPLMFNILFAESSNKKTMEAYLKQPAEMDFSSDGNIAERRKKWRKTLQ